jgi:hypothetical protein
MVKADDGVVRIAHDNNVARGASLPPLVRWHLTSVPACPRGRRSSEGSIRLALDLAANALARID